MYYILVVLHLRKVFPGVYFGNTNLLDEWSSSLHIQEELNELPMIALQLLQEIMLIDALTDQMFHLLEEQIMF